MIKLLSPAGNIFSVIFSPCFSIWLKSFAFFESSVNLPSSFIDFSNFPLDFGFSSLPASPFLLSLIKELPSSVKLLSVIIIPFLVESIYSFESFRLSPYFLFSLESILIPSFKVGLFILKISTFLLSFIKVEFSPG